jgi:Icc-related predicted phosphoesterase
MKLVAFSDTHGHWPKAIPDGDVVIFAGDLMTSGFSKAEVIGFAGRFSDLPHKHKIMVAGNHDRLFETNQVWCRSQFTQDVIHLRDEAFKIDQFKFYGSPVTPWFHNWAFNVPRGKAVKEYWDKIPDDTDVLITHGPPYGIQDKMVGKSDPLYDQYEHLGCEELMKAVQRVKPKFHIFGHIHGGRGKYEAESLRTTFCNVAICNEAYEPVHAPVVIKL